MTRLIIPNYPISNFQLRNTSRNETFSAIIENVSFEVLFKKIKRCDKSKSDTNSAIAEFVSLLKYVGGSVINTAEQPKVAPLCYSTFH